MNRTTRNVLFAHQCFALIVRNRSSCLLCTTRQTRPRWWTFTSRPSSSKGCDPMTTKSFLVPKRYICKVRNLLYSSNSMQTNSESSVKLQISGSTRCLHSTSSSPALEELMKPVTDNAVKTPETKDSSRAYNLDPAAQKLHVEEHLNSLLDVYVNSGKVDEASEILLFHHLLGHSEPSAPLLDDIALYNTVLQGWSRKGEWDHLRELLDLMARDGLKPDMNSYAAALECAARVGGGEMKTRVEEIVKRMAETGWKMEKFNDCYFVADQRELVVKALRAVQSDFQLQPRKRTGENVCILTRDLNVVQANKDIPTLISLLTESVREDVDTQWRRELEGKISISCNLLEKERGHWHSVLQKCHANWRQSLTEDFRDRVVNFQKSSAMMGIKGLSLKPYLEALKYEEYVSLMIDEIVYLGTHGYLSSPKELYKVLGIKVMERYHLQNRQNNGILKKTQLLYEEYCKYYCDLDLRLQFSPQKYWEELLIKHADGPDIDYPDKDWPLRIQIEVGMFLYKIIKRTKIDLKLVKTSGAQLKKRVVLLFPKIFNAEESNKRSDEFEVNGNLCKMYRNAFEEESLIIANFLPMLSPPLPWTSHRVGGFLLSSAPFVRQAALGSEEQQKRINSKSFDQLSPLFAAVNYLSECPWIVNKRLLDLMASVFSEGGSLELGIPPRLSPLLRLSRVEPDMTEEEISSMKRHNSSIRLQRSRSKRLRQKLFQGLSVAAHYRDRVMWFPHTLDFRGRVYPYPNVIRHIEGDAIRSLLLFAEGKPLGPKGLDWLKLHLVNLTGLKKSASLAERLAFCDDMLTEIEDSADQPLNGRRWWSRAKEPWQALSTCIEITNALRSPDPQSYVCHLPVHQDGSSNGLQHYAALGRDSEGARLVNLSAQEVPQDIYSEVAKAVEEDRKKDAADGLEIAQILEGFIQRNVVKETVMTTVNGVISRNSRLQIARLLEEASFPSEHAQAAAEYISNKAFTSTRNIFKASSEIQKWLMECAVQITQVSGRPVEWETPLGFPIVQPYLLAEKKWNDADSENQEDDPEMVVMKKQRRAFPPNYIQSLESSHMMLTALFCQKAGITFAAVHDSYWTHPSTIDVMNKICREQFVKLHSMPLLETLADSMVENYCRHTDLKDPSNAETLKKVLSAVPEKGNFDLKEVLSSTYFFS